MLAAFNAPFEKNLGRHPGLVRAKEQAPLESRVGGSDQLWSLAEI